jgi:hypothetical protein
LNIPGGGSINANAISMNNGLLVLDNGNNGNGILQLGNGNYQGMRLAQSHNGTGQSDPSVLQLQTLTDSGHNGTFTWQLGVLDLSTLFVDHITSASGGGIYHFDDLRLYGPTAGHKLYDATNSAGSNGQFLQVNGSGYPQWTSYSPGAWNGGTVTNAITAPEYFVNGTHFVALPSDIVFEKYNSTGKFWWRTDNTSGDITSYNELMNLDNAGILTTYGGQMNIDTTSGNSVLNFKSGSSPKGALGYISSSGNTVLSTYTGGINIVPYTGLTTFTGMLEATGWYSGNNNSIHLGYAGEGIVAAYKTAGSWSESILSLYAETINFKPQGNPVKCIGNFTIAPSSQPVLGLYESSTLRGSLSFNGSDITLTSNTGDVKLAANSGIVRLGSSTGYILPYSTTSASLGEPTTYYWSFVYSYFLKYKVAPSAFDALDDLALVKNYRTKTEQRQNPITGQSYEEEVIDPSSLSFLRDENGFADQSRDTGFLLGCIKALVNRVETLENSLKENQTVT